MKNNLLTRRVAEVIGKAHLEQKLKGKKKLRVKLGIDPTGADLHLGHAVTLWKLREFQDAGHKAVFIIGDWTAMIGDPSGKNETRQPLNRKQVKANARHFLDQAFLVLDKKKTEVRMQSEWFDKFGLDDYIHLASKVTESKLLSHETFRERLKKDLPFFHHETSYPLLQGYDSVEVRSDVEIGAMEQKFNLLMGRIIQRAYGQEPQDVVMVDYLIGLDGTNKMGKTTDNFIALSEKPEEMYGKVMSIPDNLIGHYFELCTDVAEKEIFKIKKAHPRVQKARLALEIVMIYHGAKKAEAAAEQFEKKFGKSKGKVKADFTLKKKAGSYAILDLLVAGKLAFSKSDARRKVLEGAVEVDGKRVRDASEKVSIKKDSLIRLGKRFLRIK